MIRFSSFLEIFTTKFCGYNKNREKGTEREALRKGRGLRRGKEGNRKEEGRENKTKERKDMGVNKTEQETEEERIVKEYERI